MTVIAVVSVHRVSSYSTVAVILVKEILVHVEKDNEEAVS